MPTNERAGRYMLRAALTHRYYASLRTTDSGRQINRPDLAVVVRQKFIPIYLEGRVGQLQSVTETRTHPSIAVAS